MTLAAAAIQIVAAVIDDGRGHVLVVRKHGATHFIQPGGKPEPGEGPLQALARELGEELGVVLRTDSAVALGSFSDRAVNEPGHRVQAQVWWVQAEGIPQVQAEIAELAWVPLQPPHGRVLAPLSERHILPAARRVIGLAGR
ncbi:NUDIX domain-containing protein [Stenotrophomonas sp. C3(2023)]|uniref:NUDIX hydrolase n=1 Tax=Stenotrophomonas sp. C3(2023) TaxID=3080277 RepID=UPI00293C3692|nr:NUDIX domain-containing protein [Stenotrophomonas sp. C3(2023)]MDV3470115.1 NUDIX domain-containing protein [Stenotrophomonas sp. C3(2023)]